MIESPNAVPIIQSDGSRSPRRQAHNNIEASDSVVLYLGNVDLNLFATLGGFSDTVNNSLVDDYL